MKAQWLNRLIGQDASALQEQAFAELLHPFSAPSPCGSDVASSELFLQVKEQLALLSGQDIARLEQDCCTLLQTEGKDIRPAVYLTYAWIRQRGWQGLSDGLQFLSALLSRFGSCVQAISLFAAKAGIKLYANQGKVDIQAQGGELLLSSQQDTQIRSLKKISLAAQEEIVLSVGGNAVRITAEGIRTLGNTTVYGPFSTTSKQQLQVGLPDFPVSQVKTPLQLQLQQGPEGGAGWARMPYTVLANGVEINKGVMGADGTISLAHEASTQRYQVRLGNGARFEIPVAQDFSNPAKGELANQGLPKLWDETGVIDTIRQRYQALLTTSATDHHDSETS